MIGWLLERIFMDKKGRESRKKARRLKESPAGRLAAKQASEEDDETGTEAGVDPEREKLLSEAMTIFRQRRAEYDKLDDAVRDRIDKAASEAFGDKDK
jgi:hypothetical protein